VPGLLAALCAGAKGAIVAVSALMPSVCLDLLTHVRAGRLDEARELQRRLTPLGRAVTTTYGIPGLKVALDISGFCGGDPRPPLGPLPADAVERIRVLLDAAH